MMKSLKQRFGQWFNSTKAPILGSREINVLKALWNHGELSAQTLHNRFTDANISLSTVQSTLERLHRKQLVSRKKVGRSFIYQAQIDQSTLVCDLLKDITVQLSDGNMAPVISGFMDYMADVGQQSSPNFEPTKKGSAAKTEHSNNKEDFVNDGG